MYKKGEGFLLDANVFIDAHRHYYRFGVCPGYWDALVWHEVATIDKVKNELLHGEDVLTDWFKANYAGDCIIPTDNADFISPYTEAIRWVQDQSYTAAAKEEFGDKADSWLVAVAKATNRVLVTLEQPKPKKRGKVFIPDVCQALNVPHVNTFRMLEDLETQFTWQPPA